MPLWPFCFTSLIDCSNFSFDWLSRDEEEVAGYAEAMDLIFDSYDEIQINENHIKQIHRVLLRFSTKDARHRGEYKKFPNHVEAFSSDGKSLGIIFETASPFETPFKMAELVEWFNREWGKGDLGNSRMRRRNIWLQ